MQRRDDVSASRALPSAVTFFSTCCLDPADPPPRFGPTPSDALPPGPRRFEDRLLRSSSDLPLPSAGRRPGAFGGRAMRCGGGRVVADRRKQLSSRAHSTAGTSAQPRRPGPRRPELTSRRSSASAPCASAAWRLRRQDSFERPAQVGQRTRVDHVALEPACADGVALRIDAQVPAALDVLVEVDRRPTNRNQARHAHEVPGLEGRQSGVAVTDPSQLLEGRPRRRPRDFERVGRHDLSINGVTERGKPPSSVAAACDSTGGSPCRVVRIPPLALRPPRYARPSGRQAERGQREA